MSKHSGPLASKPAAPASADQTALSRAIAADQTAAGATPLSKHSGPLSQSQTSKPAD